MELKIICARCEAPFTVNCAHLGGLKLKSVPRRCPRCNDEIQKRPGHGVVVRRELLEEWGAVRIALPDRFREWRDPVSGCISRRAVFKGSDGGDVLWTGRMDVWDTRPTSDALGKVRLMCVRHETIHAETAAATDRARFWAGIPSEGASDEEREAAADRPSPPRKYRYLAIDPTDADDAESALVYASASWKSTLKGFGRQYGCDIDDYALWSYQMRCQGRKTGRFGSRMIIALVDDEHPVVAHVTGDGAKSTKYSLSSPCGEPFDAAAPAWREEVTP